MIGFLANHGAIGESTPDFVALRCLNWTFGRDSFPDATIAIASMAGFRTTSACSPPGKGCRSTRGGGETRLRGRHGLDLNTHIFAPVLRYPSLTAPEQDVQLLPVEKRSLQAPPVRGFFAAEAAKAEYDQARCLCRLPPSYDSQTRKSQLGASHSPCPGAPHSIRTAGQAPAAHARTVYVVSKAAHLVRTKQEPLLCPRMAPGGVVHHGRYIL